MVGKVDDGRHDRSEEDAIYLTLAHHRERATECAWITTCIHHEKRVAVSECKILCTANDATTECSGRYLVSNKTENP